MKTRERAVNFYPGPAVLPLPVLEQAQKELVSYGSSGMSVMEMSHRSTDFEAIRDRAEDGLRRLMGIPDTHAVLFLGGGASLQFSMVPMNLFLKGKPVDILHTGTWTKKAMEETKKVAEFRLAASTEADSFRRIPRADEIKVSPDASYVYFCSNNTIEGTEWRKEPMTGPLPLCADMTSDILSKPVDVTRYGLIFAGAQKNLGPAGVTVVIVRKDLVERADKNLPTMLQYRTHVKERSLYNTPPTFPIYMMALMMEWMEKEGGVKVIEQRNEKKAALLYTLIEENGFYTSPVATDDRSRMNVIFRIKGGDASLEKKFLNEAENTGLVGLEGHRSVGGLRASIYNALPVEGVQALADLMKEFQRTNG